MNRYEYNTTFTISDKEKTDQHRLSTFLHPKLKKFAYSIDEKSKAIGALKKEYDNYNLINDSPCTNALDYTPENLNTCAPTSTIKM